MSLIYLELLLLIQVLYPSVTSAVYDVFPASARTLRDDDMNSSIHDRFKRSPVFPVLLINEPDCKDDIRRLCETVPPGSNDLFVLECILSKVAELVNEKCQHIIWKHMQYLVDGENLKTMTSNVCGADIGDVGCGEVQSDRFLTCLISGREKMKSDPCRELVHRLEWVAFSDFRIITQFNKDCRDDIINTDCGREQASEALSQGRILACLQQHIGDLKNRKCQQQVLDLSEMQGEDVKLDRQLYLACVEDQQRFCADVPRASGKVYKCLMQHKLDHAMTKECQDHLSWRQKLIAQDYRVSRGLVRACREDIRTYHCRKAVSTDKEIRLAQILLCLEGVIRNGTKVNKECQAEMIEHRKILMEDYRLSPEIVSSCPDDIAKFCKGLEVGGRTIHCLMDHTRRRKKKERISAQCQRALEVLVKNADAGEDWRVDPVLREACKPVVDRVCQDTRGGDARVMSCLMEKLGSDYMTEDCETALLQIQYFVARDFNLDPQLYRECRDDAVRFCHAKQTWVDEAGQMDPDRGPLVLPCLYRYAYHPDETMKLHSSCLAEIRRVMRQRAVSVDLQPEIEEVCLEDIALNCLDKTRKGEEMLCLQDKLDTLGQDCRSAVSNFTEVQAEHIELNPIIMSMCRKVMERHCEAELEADKDEGDVMECLVEHKNEPDVRAAYKCRAAIEHYQLISLKNYHFTYKFKEACRYSVGRFCPTAKNKADVIACLSEIMRNDTIKETKHSIPKECRQQLRAQLLQQHESIDLNPKLKAACGAEIDKFCGRSSKGASQVLECLQQVDKDQLGNLCHKAVFNIERQELQDSSVDYVLLTTCQQMIRQFCHQEDQSQALACLKMNKDDRNFDPKCKTIVVRRMIEQSTDYRFNPLLQKGCRKDISKFCADIVDSAPADSELDGKVVKCLKKKFRDRKLSIDCEKQMTVILREAALNYKLNPLLESMCQEDIRNLCGKYLESDEGAVEECLKNAFYEQRIEHPECQVEVANLIEEAKADIHVDPILHKACSIDLDKYCNDIPQGSGRHIQCLQAKLQDPNQPLLPDCQKKLTKRMEMFKIADKIQPPETIGELYTSVTHSRSRKYFIILAFSIVGVVFIMGLFCGRVTRRTLMMKNK